MKPDGKAYEEIVAVPHVWEESKGEHHLVRDKVSEYIRELEADILTLRAHIAEHIKSK